MIFLYHLLPYRFSDFISLPLNWTCMDSEPNCRSFVRSIMICSHENSQFLHQLWQTFHVLLYVICHLLNLLCHLVQLLNGNWRWLEQFLHFSINASQVEDFLSDSCIQNLRSKFHNDLMVNECTPSILSSLHEVWRTANKFSRYLLVHAFLPILNFF